MATLTVDETVSGFEWPAKGGSTELDPGQLAAWVTNSDQNSVTRIDLAAPGATSPEPEPTLTSALPEGKLLLQIADRVEVLDRDGTRRVLGDDLFALDLSPDGSLALVSTMPGDDGAGTELLTIDLASGERSTITATGAAPYPARWSPDGSKIAYRADDVLCLVETQVASPTCMPELGRVYWFDWAPDSQRLVLGLPPPEPLTLLDVVSSLATPLVPSDDQQVLSALEGVGFGRATRVQFESPRWSPSGEYIATLAMVFETVGGQEGNLVLVFDTGGNLIAQGKPMGEYSDARGWSPSADVFAYGWGGAPYDIVPCRRGERSPSRQPDRIPDDPARADIDPEEHQLVVGTAHGHPGRTLSYGWRKDGRWIPGVRERDLDPRHDLVRCGIDLQDVSLTGVGLQGEHPHESLSDLKLLPHGDPERDPRDDLVGCRIDPQQGASLGTRTGSGVINGPQGTLADRQRPTDVGDPRDDLVRDGIDPFHEEAEVRRAVALNAGPPDAASARGDLLDVALDRDAGHHLVRHRVDPNNEVVLPGLLRRHAYPDGTLPDGDVLRIRPDGDDRGHARLQIDGRRWRGLAARPIDRARAEPEPHGGEAGAVDSESARAMTTTREPRRPGA
ncbi:MAG: TolB family protein [Actinomycetota bacterium]